MSEVEKLVSILEEMELEFKGIEKRIAIIKQEMKEMREVLKTEKKWSEAKELKISFDMSKYEGEKPNNQK